MKRKGWVVLAAAAIAGAVLLSGCKKNVGTPEDNAVTEKKETDVAEGEEDAEKLPGMLFGYSGTDLDNPYYETLEKSMATELKSSGDSLITKDAKSDSQTQEQQIDELIEEGVDAVFLCPVDWDAITPSLEKLQEAGIPVINLDTKVRETDLTDAYVGSDNTNAGYVCGEDLITRFPKGGKILILESPDVNSINERITGFEQAVSNSGFEVLNRGDAKGDRETAKQLMKDFLSKYPHIDAVMCGNDRIALGAMDAVKEAGRTEVSIYGVDGSPEVKAQIASGDSPIIATGAQSPINIGKTAVKTGLAILEDKKFEKETYVETFLINQDNVEMYGTDGWQ